MTTATVTAAHLTAGMGIVEGSRVTTVNARDERACTPMHVHVKTTGGHWCYHRHALVTVTT